MADTPARAEQPSIDVHSTYADGTPRTLTNGHRTSSLAQRSGSRGIVDWLFRNRRTGERTFVQLPNAPIIVWFVASVVHLFWDPSVAGWDVLTVVSTGALAFWACDEVLRGVNPFRRMLGAGVLVWLMVGLVR